MRSAYKTAIVTQPTGMLLSLAEVKAHLRVTHTAEDGYIQSLMMAAIAQVENITNRKLLTQTWIAYYDGWPSGGFVLPYGQLQSVTTVKYRDSDDTEYTWDSTEYIVDTVSDPGQVVLGYSETYPNETLKPSNPIYIQFTCGYGDHTIKSITGCTNASPIVITIVGHGYATGDRVSISSVGGNTNANGAWNITRLTADTFSLDGSSGNDAAYTASTGQCFKIEVPEPIRSAVKLLVGDMYAHRESVAIQSGLVVVEVPGYINNLLGSYRLWPL